MPTYAQIKNPAIPLEGVPSCANNGIDSSLYSRSIQAATLAMLTNNFPSGLSLGFNNGAWRNLSTKGFRSQADITRLVAAAAAWIL